MKNYFNNAQTWGFASLDNQFVSAKTGSWLRHQTCCSLTVMQIWFIFCSDFLKRRFAFALSCQASLLQRSLSFTTVDVYNTNLISVSGHSVHLCACALLSRDRSQTGWLGSKVMGTSDLFEIASTIIKCTLILNALLFVFPPVPFVSSDSKCKYVYASKQPQNLQWCVLR